MSMNPLDKLKESHTEPFFEVLKITSTCFYERPFTGVQQHGGGTGTNFASYNPQEFGQR